MKIEQRPLSEIHPYDRNPRINDDAVDEVAASIEEFGFRQPIVVDETSIIVVGHTRLKAAIKLGLAKAPVHVAKDLSPAQVQAYRIADNRLAELAEWNLDLLPLELADLQGAEFDLSLLGFDEDALARLMGTEVKPGLTDPDEVPEPPEEPITQHGNLWILGEHRLLCGDSTSPEDVARLMDGDKASLVLTDPPYGVSYEGKTDQALTIQNDGAGDLEVLLPAAFGQMIEHSRPGAVWYVAAPAGPQFLDFARVLTELGVWRQTLAWVKDSMVLGRSDYHYKHEAVFYGWSPGAAHRAPPDRTRTSVFEFARPKASREHPTMKPIALWNEFMGNSTIKGELVLDLFAGSGTTIIAAEQLDRRAAVMELEPKYCDVIVDRWEKFTGRKAERENAPALAEA